MALLNTNIGPERVQVFDQPLGTVQVPGVATAVTAFLISSTKSSAVANTPTKVFSLDQFTTAFGGADDVADDGYYAVRGFYDNAGTGATAIIVDVGPGTAEVTDITAVADVSSSLNSKFFTMSSAYDRKKYYVWISVAGAGVDPVSANPGRTGIKVSIAVGATAAQVASAIQAAVDPLTDFTATVLSATVTITAAAGGPATDTAEGSAPTGFMISTTTQGARPTAMDYIGDASTGTGLRALDTQDIVGLVCVPGLPLETAWLVQSSLVDYTQVVRAEFGATLSTSFSLLAVPKEITTTTLDKAVLSATVSSVSGMDVVLSTLTDDVTPGMVLSKAGSIVGVVTASDVGTTTVTLTSVGSLAMSDAVVISIPSAVTYKDTVVNNPSRMAAWYHNPVIVTSAASGAASGAVLDIDPVGHVAGVIARIDANTAIGGPSHAPAGIQYAAIAGIQGLALTLSERLDGEPLRLAFINRITSFPGQGNIIFGGYTAGGDSVTADEQLIQVIRSLQFMKGSLERGLIGFLWENFSPTTQEAVARAIQAFLRNNDYLFPAGLPESQKFRVISVEPTQDELDQGLLRVRVQVKPNKAVRFIEITLEYPLPTA